MVHTSTKYQDWHDFAVKEPEIRSAYMKDQANVPIVNIEDKNVQKLIRL